MKIIFKEKQNSSGVIRNGEIILYISSRLPYSEQQRHIQILTSRLTLKLERARQLALRTPPSGLPPGLTPSSVQTDAQLAAWARELNDRWYGFSMGKVHFRKQESRWGSCSAQTHNIQISRRLQGGPAELLEYVLIHEIAHLGQFDHSRRFWALVERACPDWRARRALLRRFGEYLRGVVDEGG